MKEKLCKNCRSWCSDTGFCQDKRSPEYRWHIAKGDVSCEFYEEWKPRLMTREDHESLLA